MKQQTIPHCAPGEQVGVNLTFPQCWDGINLDSADHRSHLAYVDYVNGKPVCPSTHPVHVPEFTLGIWFTHDGNSENWYLASDRMPGMKTYPNGSSFHSDWLGAWDPTIQRQVHEELHQRHAQLLGRTTRRRHLHDRTSPVHRTQTPPQTVTGDCQIHGVTGLA